jgi:hypothetical protein
MSSTTATLRWYNNKHRGQRGFLSEEASLTTLKDSGFDFINSKKTLLLV